MLQAHRVEPSEDQVCKFVSHGEYLVRVVVLSLLAG